MTLSEAGTYLTLLSTMLTVFATLFHAAAFGADFWLTNDGRPRPFLRIGMHEACFDKCTAPYCPAGDDFTFNGCYRLGDEYFDELRWWLTPAWFVHVRVLTIVAVPLTGITMLIMIGAALIIGCWRYPHAKPRSRDILLQVLLFIGAVFQLASGMLLVIIIARFYGNAFRQDWMPFWDTNQLGWSYWLEVAAIFFFMFGFCFSLSAGIYKVLRMRKGPKDPQISEDMMLGKR